MSPTRRYSSIEVVADQGKSQKPAEGSHALQLEMAQSCYMDEDQPTLFSPARAERLSAVVQGPEALADYEAWLTTYVANWLPYVAETCPRIAVGDELRDRLTSRARHWIRVAEQRPAV